MTADPRCRRGAASVTAVAGEDEELCGGEGENLAFQGCAGGFIFTRLFAPPSSLSVHAPLAAKVGGYVSALREKNDIFPSVFGDLEPKPTL